MFVVWVRHWDLAGGCVGCPVGSKVYGCVSTWWICLTSLGVVGDFRPVGRAFYVGLWLLVVVEKGLLVSEGVVVVVRAVRVGVGFFRMVRGLSVCLGDVGFLRAFGVSLVIGGQVRGNEDGLVYQAKRGVAVGTNARLLCGSIC